MVLGLHFPPNGPATPSRFSVFAICFGERPAANSRKIRSMIAVAAGSISRSPVVTVVPTIAHDFVAEAEPTAGLPVLNAPAQASMPLLGQVLQEQRVHRSLEPDVQVRDVAFGER